MILSTVSTRNFSFETLNETEDEANSALLMAWERHCRQYGADPDLMEEFIVGGEVTHHPIELGQVLRDGEPV